MARPIATFKIGQLLHNSSAYCNVAVGGSLCGCSAKAQLFWQWILQGLLWQIVRDRFHPPDAQALA
jgi:hypothetical protein